MQPVDQPVRFVQFAPQIARAGIHAGRTPGPGPPVPRIDDFELPRNVGNLVVQRLE